MLLLKLDLKTIAAENLKKKELFLDYYKNKGQLDSLKRTEQFKTTLNVIGKSFNFKLNDSFSRVRKNNFIKKTDAINKTIERMEQQIAKLIN
ncbi:hypothetical protein D3C87_1322190 [compost metagenome]